MESSFVVILDILRQAPVVAYLFLNGSVESLKLSVRLLVVWPQVYQLNAPAEECLLEYSGLPVYLGVAPAHAYKAGSIVRQDGSRCSEPPGCLQERHRDVLRGISWVNGPAPVTYLEAPSRNVMR